MMRWLCGLPLFLLLAFGGLILLVWWLWRLWSREEKEGALPGIEIRAKSPAIEAEAVAAEVAAEVPDVAVAAPVVEADGQAPPAIARSVEVGVEAPPLAAETLVEDVGLPTVAEHLQADDLKRIEGIGPKLSSVLQSAGIATFAQLAGAEADRLKRILEEEDPRLLQLADPTTWPEQAALAAAGNWDALEALQAELKGGRR